MPNTFTNHRRRQLLFALLAGLGVCVFAFLERSLLFPRKFPRSLTTGEITPVCVAFSPDGKIIAAGGGLKSAPKTPHKERSLKYGSVYFWDAYTGSAMRGLDGFDANVTALAFSPNGQSLVVGTNFPYTRLTLWDMHTRKQLLVLQTSAESKGYRIDSVAFSPDGTTIAAGYSESEEICIWDTATGALRKVQTGMTNEHSAVAFSPDGKTLGAIGQQKFVTGPIPGSPETWKYRHFIGAQVRLYDTLTWKERKALPGETVRSLMFSPDGKTLVSASDIMTSGGSVSGSTVRLVDIKSSRTLWMRRVPGEDVSAVRFSPDGNRLVTSGVENTISDWDARTGARRWSFPGHDNPWQSSADDIAFSADGKQFASCRNGQILLWNTTAL